MKRVLAILLGLAVAGGGATYLSHTGVEHTSTSEGLRYTAYPDPGSGGAPWTICWGSTKGVYRGLTQTHQQCEQRLAADLWTAERAVQRRLKHPVRQGEYDALVSFTFNVGEGNLSTSTLLKMTNAGQWPGNCQQYARWVYASGKKLKGLQVRRYDEATLCLQGGPYVFYP